MSNRYVHRPVTAYPIRTKVTDTGTLTVNVALACGHSNTYGDPAPRPGGSAFCRSCRAYTRGTKEPTDV